MAKASSRNLPGASFNTRAQKWQARIEISGERKHLGYFETAEEASAAYVEAKGSRAKVRTEAAVKARPDRPRAVRSTPLDPWDVNPETLAALVPSWMSTGPDGKLDAVSLFTSDALSVAAIVSRLENVSVYTACELTACDDGSDGAVDRLRQRVQRLRALGLIDRASEVVDLVMAANSPRTFDEAVALLGAGDLV